MFDLKSRLATTLAIVAGCVALGGCNIVGALVESAKHPPKPFEATTPPPAPDYAQGGAWMAWPGRDGLERSTPPGFKAIDEAAAPADLFFIHPTTYTHNDVWNAAFDADAAMNKPVLLDQISIFNGCCRLYAPHYRQSSLKGLGEPRANEVAYGDVLRAFRYYIEHENHGRPFIISGHSQGAFVASRLLQDAIIGTPLQKQLVAAYVIGGNVPANFADVGLPVCDSPRQTGCIVDWNTSQVGKTGAHDVLGKSNYWWKGKSLKDGAFPMMCVNPLTWTIKGAAPASANPGSLPFPAAPFPAKATTLEPLWVHLTGAECKDQVLQVDVSGKAPKGYKDMLATLYGSYHINDMGMFYASIRQNAVDRVAAFTAQPK